MGNISSEALIIQSTKDTPDVVLDAANHKFEIIGRSFPLNAKGFYAPVQAWLEDYSTVASGQIHFTFKLEYFNTPSSKSISDILKTLKKMKDAGSDVKVSWHYEEDDVDILDLGHVFSRTIGLEFDFQAY